MQGIPHGRDPTLDRQSPDKLQELYVDARYSRSLLAEVTKSAKSDAVWSEGSWQNVIEQMGDGEESNVCGGEKSKWWFLHKPLPS